MIYKRDTGAMLDEEVVADVNAVGSNGSLCCDSSNEDQQFIQYYAEGKKETSHRPKPVPSGADFVTMLHFLYFRDTTTYPDERQRVQQGFLMIIHASSGLRPSSVTQSSKGRQSGACSDNAKEVEDVVKLRYRDTALLINEDEQGRTRFAVQATFQYFKGGNRRPQRFVPKMIASKSEKPTDGGTGRLSRGQTRRMRSHARSLISPHLRSTTKLFRRPRSTPPAIYFL